VVVQVFPEAAKAMGHVHLEAAINFMFLTGCLICNYRQDKKSTISLRSVLRTEEKFTVRIPTSSL
jgi:hypothetical protein